MALLEPGPPYHALISARGLAGRPKAGLSPHRASALACRGEDISRTCAECFVLCSLTLSSLCHLWGSCSALGVDIVGTVCFTSVYFIPAELQDVMFTLGKPSALPAHAWPAWIYHWAARERNAAAGKASGRREQKGNTLLGEQPSALLGSGRSPAVLPVRRGSLEQR